MGSVHLIAAILHIKKEGVWRCSEQLFDLGRREDVGGTNGGLRLSDESQEAARPLLQEVDRDCGRDGADSDTGAEFRHEWIDAV